MTREEAERELLDEFRKSNHHFYAIWAEMTLISERQKRREAEAELEKRSKVRGKDEMTDNTVTDNRGRVWTHAPALPPWSEEGTKDRISLDGKWLHDGREASSMPDIERARREETLCGDPMIAGVACSYKFGTIIDYFCLACGSVYAAHDEDSDCWRILKSDEELRKYDEAMEIANSIRWSK